MVAVIAGATGLVGGLLLPKLLDASEITKVISVGRRGTGVKHPKLEEVTLTNLQDLSAHRDKLKGVFYFCCLGTTIKAAGSQENFYRVDHDAVLEFGKVAKANSAGAFLVVTASGANAKSFIYYNRVKGEIERDLHELGLNRLVIFHPALLLGERKDHRAAESKAIWLSNHLTPWLPEFITKRAVTPAEVLAEKMLAVALRGGSGKLTIEAADI